jgi:hypothetical protein
MNAGKYTEKLKELLRGRETRSFAITMVISALVIAASYYAADRLSARKNYAEREVRMSVFNSGSSGTMALREFIEGMGVTTGRILRTLDRFDLETAGRNGGVKNPGLVVIFEPELPLQKKEVLMLTALAERGVNVLAASAGEEKIAGILHTLSAEKFPKVRGEMYLEDVHESASKTVRGSDVVRNVRALELPGKKRFRTWHRDWEVLLRDRQGVLALRKRIGSGSIVLLSDGEFASNINLGKADNGLFAWNLIRAYAGGSAVQFDEYHHGYSRRFTLLYFLARREYLAVAIQAVLFFSLLAAAAWVRFGQVRTARRDGDETIFYFTRGMAGLMEERRYRGDLASLMVSNFRRMDALRKDAAPVDRLRRAEDLLKKLEGKAPGRRVLRKLFNIVKGDGDGNTGIR